MQNEVDPQFVIVEVVEHHKRRARNRINPQAKLGMGRLSGRIAGQKRFEGIVNPISFLGDNPASEASHTLTQHQIELFKRCL